MSDRNWPDDPPLAAMEADPRLHGDLDVERTAGPEQAEVRSTPDAVWLTAESLGDDDPALTAHPRLPAVFVFDLPLLSGCGGGDGHSLEDGDQPAGSVISSTSTPRAR